MIRYKVKELLAEKSRQTGRAISIQALADAIDMDRTTMSKLINKDGYVTTTKVLDGLCRYFQTDIAGVIEYVPDEDESAHEPM